MVADHWFMQIEKVLEVMEITSDVTRIRLAAFQLEGEAQVWWKWARTSRDLEAMTMMDYVTRFTELARFTDDYVATDLAKVRRFENGLKLSIRARIIGLRLQDMDSIVGTALTIEREIEDARSTRDAGVSSKRKESQSSSSSGKR